MCSDLTPDEANAFELAAIKVVKQHTFFLLLAFCLNALIVEGEGWNVQAGNESEKWRRMSVEERENFVVEIKAKIDATIADTTPDALISEKNSAVSKSSGESARSKTVAGGAQAACNVGIARALQRRERRRRPLPQSC